jgi:hypothetical protein
MQMRRKVVWLAVLLVVAALLIVLCVTLYVKNQPEQFDGTLVNNQSDWYIYDDNCYGEV